MIIENSENITSANNIFRFTKNSYNEALSLLIFSRDYFNQKGRIDKLNLSGEDSIIYTIAMSTITTQLTSSISWLLMCKAVEKGEISIDELKSDDFCMPEYESHLDLDNSCFSVLNETVLDLLTKSSNMYNRIKRMENSVRKMLEEDSEKELVH